MTRVVAVGPKPLSTADVVAVARARVPVELTAEAHRAMAATRAHIDALAADERPHYGVSTGFGLAGLDGRPQAAPCPGRPGHRARRRSAGRGAGSGAPLRPAPASAAVLDALHAAGVAGAGPDRHLAPEIATCAELVRSGRLLDVVADFLP